MAQPDDFGFGEDAALLKQSARRFFAEHLPTDALHALVAAEHDPEQQRRVSWPAQQWQAMVDLGWTALAIPERAGGLGMPCVAVAGLMEELGRAAFPCPLLGTLAASYVLSACAGETDQAFAELGQGLAASLAITDSRGSCTSGTPDVRYDGNALTGTAWYVQDAGKVDRLLVSAQGDAGLRLFWVDVQADGVTIRPDAIIDLTRDQARIEFAQVGAACVSENGLATINAALPALWTLLAADMVGAAEWQLQTTAEYARSRSQFDHALGFFQAVKHPLVDVMLHVDESASLVYAAACAIDCEPARAAQAAHMAKASASDTAAFASGRSVQLHGGIGFTWEAYLHLYFKRQKHSQLLWGDGIWHRARLADILMGEAA